MSLFGAIAKASKDLQRALDFADNVFQNQVVIETQKGDDLIYFTVVESEDLEIVVEPTEQPIERYGGGLDYLNRTSTPLVLSGIISPRNLDLRALGFETFFLGTAAKYAPAAIARLRQLQRVTNKFFDFGADEVTAILAKLLLWQNDGVLVKVRNLRADLKKLTKSVDDVLWLIERVKITSDVDVGDGLAVELTLKNLIIVDAPKRGGLSGVRAVVEKFVKIPVNPFS